MNIRLMGGGMNVSLAIISLMSVLIALGLVSHYYTGNWIPSLNDAVEHNDNPCVNSPYIGRYTNASTGISYWKGQCIISVPDWYETKKECGFLGISCYETSKSHSVQFNREICFDYKTGELC